MTVIIIKKLEQVDKDKKMKIKDPKYYSVYWLDLSYWLHPKHCVGYYPSQPWEQPTHTIN